MEADRLEKENLRQQIEYLTKKLFGTSSEKRKDIAPFLLVGIDVLRDHSVGLNAFGCSISSPDSKILAYKDMINQLNKTISTQTELIQSLQKTLEADRLEKVFHCSYYTIKSNEKEAENPAFTRDFRHDITVYYNPSIFCRKHKMIHKP